jgi:hypothetical protein
MSNDYIRLCPVCGAENPPAASQCAACGTLLIGVDLSLRAAAVSPPAAEAPAAPVAGVVCAHADCGATNPAGHADCLYCGRPLQAEAPAAPSAGLYKLPTALVANFTIERVLPAAGAEAELMLLKGVKTGVRVMAKLYRPGVAPKGEVLERVAAVAHAHVVRLLKHGVSDGLAYEVMEFCSGGSLRNLMAQRTTPELVRTILSEVAEALAALHDAKVIHRDLKPENVLVRRLEPLDLVLTDFGIASLNDATQLFTTTARTARYAAPEALTGVLDASADYWSLGMILVEMLAGAHPFAGLSDPVISHRLATGNIDVDTLVDPAWRKLCRGLLQRDPVRRWGIAEIRRWLADDATLPEPAPNSALLAHPYRLEGEECRNHEELAAAFSRHWEAAAKDLARGQFEAWVREELKEHDLLRFLHDLKERGGTADLHLFRLIRHLAPTIPPAWRGASLAADGIAAMAARASDDDSQAAHWLTTLFDERVLDLLPAEDFPAEASLAERWRIAWGEFVDQWRAAGRSLDEWRNGRVARGEAVMDIDTLMFSQTLGLERPPAGPVHASLLLMMQRPELLPVLRTKVLSEAASHTDHSPWLDDLVRLAETSSPALVVLLHLMPQARRASEEGQKTLLARQERGQAALNGLTRRVNEALAAMRDGAEDLLVLSGEERRRQFGATLDAFMALGMDARDLIGNGSSAESPTMGAIARAEPLVTRMRDELEAWQSAGRINAVWRNQHVVNTVAGVAVFLLMLAPAWLPAALAIPALFLAWRFWILSEHRHAIRRLAAALPWYVPGSGGERDSAAG